MKTKISHFSTAEGKELAQKLAEHIARTEVFQNWDECIDDLREMLCTLADKKHGIAVSALLRAEDLNRLEMRFIKGRYKVAVQRDERELELV